MKTIYQDEARILTLFPNGIMRAESKRGTKNCRLSIAAIAPKHPTGVPESIKKMGEDPLNWYTLLEGSQPVVTLPNATRQAIISAIEEAKTIEAERKAIEEAEKLKKEQAARAACPVDHVLARQEWSNGDLCSAKYVTEDGIEVIATDLLEAHHGWYYLPVDRVEEERAIQEAKKAKVATEKAEREKVRTAKFAEAKATGRPVKLDSYSVECNNPREECSLDIITIYAMPNGTEKKERIHTW